MKNFDVIVIGTGQAGPSVAARFADAGKKVAVIERHLFGGTCVNTGCTPTKTLVASARAAHMARRGKEYGVLIDGPVTVDMKAVKARKDAIVAASNQGVEQWMTGQDNITVYRGHARFTAPYTLQVGDETLTAEKIFINVGGRPRIPQGFESVPYLTNADILELEEVPAHLVIIGGSYVGLEFAQMFRRFGSDVTVIEKSDRLLPKEDDDMASAVKEILEAEGIHFRVASPCLHGEKEGDAIAVYLDGDDPDKKVMGTHVLLATGRLPNTDDLGLEHTEVKRNDRGYIQVNDQLETSVPGIYALGDCNGRGAFTHTAYNDYEIVSDNILNGTHRSVNDRILCYALYIDPALGRIGMTETQVRQSGKKALMATRAMENIARAREKGETQGLMKILVDADTEKILGAAILGIEGDEVIHSLLDIMYAGSSYKTILNAVHIHPTVSELIPTTLAGLKPLA